MAKEPTSVQDVTAQQTPLIGGALFSPLTFYGNVDIAPDWNAGDRDSWLRTFWPKFGNDILQAVLAVSIAKVQTQNWVIEGPEKLARFYRDLLREEVDFGRGWSSLISRGVNDYYTQDNGWFMELQRDSFDSHDGPALGIAHIDSGRMRPTGNAEYPYTYRDTESEFHLMHKSQFIRTVDMPSPVTGIYHHQRGFCALSRALSTAIVLSLLVTMKREKLSDLPPSAIAIFNNISQKQFENALSLHTIKEDAKNSMVWRTLMPLFGIDPAHPASLSFQSLREVWEGFNEVDAYNVAVYSFAAAWRIDPREFWPVSSGPLGTGKEAEIQHEKAKAKSYGLLLTEIERNVNSNYVLPKGLTFRFVLQDSDEEQQRANIHSVQIGNIKAMQDAGASFTAAEVRFLLAKVYRVVPQAMAELPPQPTPQISQPGMAPISGAGGTGGQPAPALTGQELAPGIPDNLNPVDGGAASQITPAASNPSESMSPKLAGIDIAYMDDVERDTKELGAYYGLDLGQLVRIDILGSKEYLLPYNRRMPQVGPIVIGMKQSIEASDLLAKVRTLPLAERKQLLKQAATLRNVASFEQRALQPDGISAAEWAAAEQADMEAK